MTARVRSLRVARVVAMAAASAAPTGVAGVADLLGVAMGLETAAAMAVDLDAARARQTLASRAKILATVKAVVASLQASHGMPRHHASATSNRVKTRAAHATTQEASHATTTLTTSNLPVMRRQASPHRASRQATVTTSAVPARAAAAEVAAEAAAATGHVDQAVPARFPAARV